MPAQRPLDRRIKRARPSLPGQEQGISPETARNRPRFGDSRTGGILSAPRPNSRPRASRDLPGPNRIWGHCAVSALLNDVQTSIIPRDLAGALQDRIQHGAMHYKDQAASLSAGTPTDPMRARRERASLGELGAPGRAARSWAGAGSLVGAAPAQCGAERGDSDHRTRPKSRGDGGFPRSRRLPDPNSCPYGYAPVPRRLRPGTHERYRARRAWCRRRARRGGRGEARAVPGEEGLEHATKC